jgi:hypothetical protein
MKPDKISQINKILTKKIHNFCDKIQQDDRITVGTAPHPPPPHTHTHTNTNTLEHCHLTAAKLDVIHTNTILNIVCYTDVCLFRFARRRKQTTALPNKTERRLHPATQEDGDITLQLHRQCSSQHSLCLDNS